MKKNFSKFAALLALLFYSSNILWASDYARLFGAGQRTLNQYLERALTQTEQSRFEMIVQEGLDAALFEWEQKALDLKLFGAEEWERQRLLFEERLNANAAESFEEWKEKKLYLDEESIKKSLLCAELQKAAEGFYFLDEEGKKSRQVSKEKITEAQAQWDALAEKIVLKHLNENSSGEEIEEIAFLEEKISNALMNELLYDHDSLKKISDSQAAFFVADKLASQIESECEGAIARLFNSLETQAEDVFADD
nr:hypothetical protein [Treponema sp.]